MSEVAYLDLKRTAITTTGIVFASMLGYAYAIKDLVLAQYLVGTLTVILFSIFIAYVVETHHRKSNDWKQGYVS